MAVVTVARALGGIVFITVAPPAVFPVPRAFGGTIFVTLKQVNALISTSVVTAMRLVKARYSMEKITHVTIVEKGVHELQPGEMTTHPDNQCWYIGCPGVGRCTGNLCGHTVTRIENDITVSPSILCLSCGAHYFIEHNQIRWC